MIGNRAVDILRAYTVAVVLVVAPIGIWQGNAAPAKPTNEAVLAELNSMPEDRVEAVALVVASCVEPSHDVSAYECTKAIRLAQMKTARYLVVYDVLDKLETFNIALSKPKRANLTNAQISNKTFDFVTLLLSLQHPLETYYSKK